MGAGSEGLTHAEALGRYVGAFVDELAACGLAHVCLCPGSRSTPLALAFARHPDVCVWTHLDERSCAYFALGMAKAEPGAPVAVLCSSGTAAANFAPAVIEAFHSRAPLIVLTADRPPELQEVGANQTIDQVRIYGPAVRWFLQMPLPESSEELVRYARMAARRAFRTAARGDAPGPVHLNFPFREPLMPAGWQPTPRAGRADAEEPERGAVSVEVPTPQAPPGSAPRLWERFRRARRPLIVLGRDARPQFPPLAALAAAGVPVLADVLSDARSSGHAVLAAYDSFLRVPEVAAALAPDFVLRFGAAPTSKPLATYLKAHRDVPQVIIARGGGWPDPDLTAEDVAFGDERVWGILSNLKVAPEAGWSRTWRELEAAAVSAIGAALDADATATEVSAVRDLAEVIPAGYTVFAGNSMPVRDLESFWPVTEKAALFLHNRGASGIDGVVSTALGAAARRQGRLVLLIGDLSFYHDMNGLLAARRFGLKATVVLLNNDGGGIFSFLPQHDEPEHFEALFGTPHGLDFRPAAALYGLDYESVGTRAAYREALRRSFEAEGVSVIEVRTEREANLRLHQRIWAAVAAAVAPLVTK